MRLLHVSKFVFLTFLLAPACGRSGRDGHDGRGALDGGGRDAPAAADSGGADCPGVDLGRDIDDRGDGHGDADCEGGHDTFRGEAPVITSSPLATAAMGEAYLYAITVTGSPPPDITVEGLPGWLDFDSTESTISGIPYGGDSGDSQITVTAANGIEPDAVQAYTVTVPAFEWEFLGVNESAAKQPGNTWGRALHCLYPWQGNIYMGYGDYGENTGPVDIVYYDPVLSEFVNVATFKTEQIDNYREIGGELYVPAIDPAPKQEYAVGHPDGTWDFVNCTNSLHAFDMAALGEAGLFLAGSTDDGPTLWKSADGGESWDVELEGWGQRFYFIATLDGKLYVQSESEFIGHVFDGETWGAAPSMFVAGFFGAQGYRPVEFAGKVVMGLDGPFHPNGVYVLSIYNGTAAATGRVGVRNYARAEAEGLLVVLELDECIRATSDLEDWHFIADAPPAATSIAALGIDVYVGTADSELYRAAGILGIH